MGDHVLGISVCDGREIPEGLLLTEIISESKSWHLDGQLFEFCLGEVVSALIVYPLFHHRQSMCPPVLGEHTGWVSFWLLDMMALLACQHSWAVLHFVECVLVF